MLQASILRLMPGSSSEVKPPKSVSELVKELHVAMAENNQYSQEQNRPVVDREKNSARLAELRCLRQKNNDKILELRSQIAKAQQAAAAARTLAPKTPAFRTRRTWQKELSELRHSDASSQLTERQRAEVRKKIDHYEELNIYEQEISQARDEFSTWIADKCRPDFTYEALSGLFENEIAQLDFDNVDFKLLVVGRVSTAKSSMINKITKATENDGPQFYAKTDEFECTSRVDRFEHKDLRKFHIFDSKGVGAASVDGKRCSADSSLVEMLKMQFDQQFTDFNLRNPASEPVQLEQMNAVIIMSDNRYTTDDAALMLLMKELSIPYYFVRSKLDIYLRDVLPKKPHISTRDHINELREDLCRAIKQFALQVNPNQLQLDHDLSKRIFVCTTFSPAKDPMESEAEYNTFIREQLFTYCKDNEVVNGEMIHDEFNSLRQYLARNMKESAKQIKIIESVGQTAKRHVTEDAMTMSHDSMVMAVERRRSDFVNDVLFPLSFIQGWDELKGRHFDKATCASMVETMLLRYIGTTERYVAAFNPNRAEVRQAINEARHSVLEVGLESGDKDLLPLMGNPFFTVHEIQNSSELLNYQIKITTLLQRAFEIETLEKILYLVPIGCFFGHNMTQSRTEQLLGVLCEEMQDLDMMVIEKILAST